VQPSTVNSQPSPQFLGHLDHRPPEPKPVEQLLRSMIRLGRPQHHARRAAALQPADGRVHQGGRHAKPSSVVGHGDVVHEAGGLAEFLPRLRLEARVDITDCDAVKFGDEDRDVVVVDLRAEKRGVARCRVNAGIHEPERIEREVHAHQLRAHAAQGRQVTIGSATHDNPRHGHEVPSLLRAHSGCDDLPYPWSAGGAVLAIHLIALTTTAGVMKSELEKFYRLADEIEISMMTTRRRDGHLRSRAMANQKRAEGADLWFVTSEGSAKLHDLAHDPHVNLASYRDRTREWISVSGTATISRDRQKIAELYAADWKMWFPDGGDPRHGTADGPRMVLIGVTVHAAEFLELNKPQAVVLFELVKGWVTGSEPDLGQMHELVEPRRPHS
jgi:general stress protein 26